MLLSPQETYNLQQGPVMQTFWWDTPQGKKRLQALSERAESGFRARHGMQPASRFQRILNFFKRCFAP